MPDVPTYYLNKIERLRVDRSRSKPALHKPNAMTSQQKSVLVAIADKPLLKLEEASALTGLSRDTLKKAIDSTELKAKIIGRAYRIKRANLDNYIKEL